MKLQFEKDLDFYQKVLDFQLTGVKEVDNFNEFRSKLKDKDWKNHTKQLEYYSNFMDFTREGNRFTHITPKSPEEVYSYIYKNLTDDDIIYNMVCFFDMYHTQEQKVDVVLSTNQLLRIMGINPNYIYFKPYSHFPEDYKISASKVESDIRANPQDYPHSKNLVRKINDNRQKQIKEVIEKIDKKKSYNRDSNELSEIGKEYETNSYNFTPTKNVTKAVENFYEHTGRSITTKILRVLLILQRSNIINLRVIREGLIFHEDGTIEKRLLTPDEESIYMDLKFKEASNFIGKRYSNRDFLQEVGEFLSQPPFWFSKKIEEKVPEVLPFDKIINVNYVIFGKYGVNLLKDEYHNQFKREFTQKKIIDRANNTLKDLKRKTLNNYKKREESKSTSSEERKVYEGLTNKTFTLNLQDFENALEIEWVDDLDYIPQYWYDIGKQSSRLLDIYNNSSYTSPKNQEEILIEKIKEQVQSLSEKQEITEEDINNLFDSVKREYFEKYFTF